MCVCLAWIWESNPGRWQVPADAKLPWVNRVSGRTGCPGVNFYFHFSSKRRKKTSPLSSRGAADEQWHVADEIRSWNQIWRGENAAAGPTPKVSPALTRVTAATTSRYNQEGNRTRVHNTNTTPDFIQVITPDVSTLKHPSWGLERWHSG